MNRLARFSSSIAFNRLSNSPFLFSRACFSTRSGQAAAAAEIGSASARHHADNHGKVNHRSHAHVAHHEVAPQPRCHYEVRSPPLSDTLVLDKPFHLTRSKTPLAGVQINYSRIGNPNGPVVYVMPSMSHSSNVASDESGWWSEMVGHGHEYGIDLSVYQVISASPLGGPFGTTSPLSVNPHTGMPYRASFPVITPADQANLHARLLDALGIDSVFAVIGASMGGMQALQFALLHPNRFHRLVALCTTARTSPSTVALRAVQRMAVQIDSKYNGGNYDSHDGPASGMKVARSMGTICYRSREEFDSRFQWRAHENTNTFEVESYLDHVANQFSYLYDPNCYLTLSRCMDLMDFTYDYHNSYAEACAKIPKDREFLLLPVSQDNLIQAHELNELAQELGSRGCKVHHEVLHSVYGHDFFLKEYGAIAPRIAEFLNRGDLKTSGVEKVRSYVSSLEKQ